MTNMLKKKKWMAWLVMLTFLFTSIMPTNLMAGNSVAEAGTDPYVYRTPTEGVGHYMFYQRSPHMYNDKDSDYYVAAIYRLFRENNEQQVALTYCCDLDTGAKHDIAYKRVNLEDANYYTADKAKHIRAIMNAAYPFVPMDTMKENVNTWLKKNSKDPLTADIDVGQFLSATQFAVWHFANNSVNKTYSLTHKDPFEKGPGGKGLVSNPITSYVGVNQTTQKYDSVANNISKIYSYLLALEATEAGSNQIVISEVTYDAYKVTGKTTCDVTLNVKLNTKVGKKDTITATAKVGSTSYASAEFTAGKDNLILNLTNVPLNAEIAITVDGNQYLEKGAYFYEPVNGRDTAQCFVGIAEGFTPVSAKTTVKVTDISTGLKLFKYTTVADSNVKVPLEGAVFDLYDAANNKIGTYTTDANGEIAVDFGTLDKTIDLSGHYFVETKAPAGYQLPAEKDNKYQLGENATVIEVANAPTKDFDLTLKKVDAVDNAIVLAGAKFKLEYSKPAEDTDYTVINEYTTDANGTISFTNLHTGYYKLTETAAPTYKPEQGKEIKYDMLANPITFKVDKAGFLTDIAGISEKNYTATSNLLTVENQRHDDDSVAISVKKIWNAPEGITHPEITIQLLQNDKVYKDKDGKDVVVTLGKNTAMEETHIFTGLPKYYMDNGKQKECVYTVKEMPVDGYTTSEVTGSMTNGFTITNTINQEYFGISGKKVWSDGADNHDAVTIQLFRDNKLYRTTTAQTAEWTYEFTELPRYAVSDAVAEGETADGHKYSYRVEEDVPEGYVPSYSKETTTDGYVINIKNTPIDENNMTDISVTKKWVGGDVDTVRPTIVINLLQNGEPYKTATLAHPDTNYTFTNLPKYYLKDGKKQEYTYTVSENPVLGYLPLVEGTMENGFTITNTLLLDNMGLFRITKQVTGGNAPADNATYDFVLQIKATEDVTLRDPSLQAEKDKLTAAQQNAEAQKSKAEAQLKEKEAAFKAAAFLTTESAYQFILLDGEAPEDATQSNIRKALFAADRNNSIWDFTTGSAVGFVPEKAELSDEDANEFDSLLDNVIQTIKDLFDDAIDLLQPEHFMAKLNEALGKAVAAPSALAFGEEETLDLMQAYKEYMVADDMFKSAKEELADFEAQKGTTPSAITLIMDGKELKLNHDDNHYYNAESGTYYIPFTLVKNQQMNFAIQATTGSSISYKFVENSYPQAHYKDTTVKVEKDNQQVSLFAGLQSSVEFQPLTTESVYGFTFINNYTDPGSSTGGGDGGDGDDDEDTPKENDPSEEIDEPNTPLGDPGIELDDPDVPLVTVPGEPIDVPEIPLGDAPGTGDTSNAVPFAALLLLAGAGLVLVRRFSN